MNIFQKDRLSPYLIGFCIGLLLLFLLRFNLQIGASSGIAKIAAITSIPFGKTFSGNSSYFYKLLHETSLIDFKILFLIGILFGALLAHKVTKKALPQKDHYRDLLFKKQSNARKIYLFIGGAILLFGARLAGGCTSGHAISGASQLSFVSFIFMLSFFPFAILTAQILYKKRS
jgi:uncharacterized membrane protein YedE/YeeE